MRSKYMSQTCFVPILFLIIMCPKRSRLLELQSGEIKYNFTTIKPIHPDVEIFKEIEGDPYVRLRRSPPEPGFDFTNEEMSKYKIWPYGVIPYFVDNFSFDEAMVSRLHKILKNVNFVTGLRFLELSSPPEDENERWVFFINRRGVLNCEDYNANNFTNEGVQRVVVGYDCLGASGGALASTVLALVGVPPQHNAPNRNKYIKVMMENIIPEKRNFFQVLKDSDWLFEDVEYDFRSAGHYDFHKYTANGAATIVPKEAVHSIPVGEGSGMSPNDVLKIQMLYNYISLKRPKVKASDCSKMFQPGARFRKFKPLDDTRVVPRKTKITSTKLAIPKNVKSREKEQLKNNDNEAVSSIILKHKRKKPVDKDSFTHLTIKNFKKNELKHKVEKMDDWKTSDDEHRF